MPSGTAHLCEHIRHHGLAVESRPLKALQRLGGRANAMTLHDRMSFTSTLPAPRLAEGLRIEAERLGRPLGPQLGSAVSLNRNVLLQERTQRLRSRAFEKTLEECHRLLYPPDHPYSAPPAGERAGIESIEEHHAARFLEEKLDLGNAVLVLAGDLDLDSVRAHLDETFGALPAASPPQGQQLHGLPPAEPASGTVFGTQPEVVFATRGPGYAQSGHAETTILVRALAIGRSSPLQRRLVTTRRAQEVRVCHQTMRHASTFAIIAKAGPGGGSAELEDLLDGELEAITRGGLEQRWLERARRKALKDHLTRLQELAARANLLASAVLFHGTAESLWREPAEIAEATLESTESWARELLDRSHRVTLRREPEAIPA